MDKIISNFITDKSQLCRGRLAQTGEHPPSNLAIRVQLIWRHFSCDINNSHFKWDSDTFRRTWNSRRKKQIFTLH